jgi:hypothetical protein
VRTLAVHPLGPLGIQKNSQANVHKERRGSLRIQAVIIVIIGGDAPRAHSALTCAIPRNFVPFKRIRRCVHSIFVRLLIYTSPEASLCARCLTVFEMRFRAHFDSSSPVLEIGIRDTLNAAYTLLGDFRWMNWKAGMLVVFNWRIKMQGEIITWSSTTRNLHFNLRVKD